ncbi:hypothetical protein AVEN_266769-1 [Araneus ventricosus]|uniref:Uncharacterized protein n=1 Tax=Araneus ventricosus TaxID=182803 RepID=A0A4Y2PNU9_ARAVE|nr:hypothetical protein AVEN_107496-1 [Araneus ventricosus]GBO42125.1 hypothetical protein AVEN_266769-1 [Araneus ventricosus]
MARDVETVRECSKVLFALLAGSLSLSGEPLAASGLSGIPGDDSQKKKTFNENVWKFFKNVFHYLALRRRHFGMLFQHISLHDTKNLHFNIPKSSLALS